MTLPNNGYHQCSVHPPKGKVKKKLATHLPKGRLMIKNDPCELATAHTHRVGSNINEPI